MERQFPPFCTPGLSVYQSVLFLNVYKNEQGEQSVLSAVKQWNGKYVLKEYPVVTGIDNEAAIVISGDNIYEGMRVINDPAKYKSGAIVSIE
ncbi:MAG: hypothetical protein ABRQ25_18525 [Clostridiaceae bacterium]